MTTLVPWLITLMWLLPQAQLPASSQAVPRAQVTSPHGNLNMPCENCHTFTSWRPLRSIPEFSHEKTKYPLRGMHVNVSCMQCHTSLVFSNVGTRCADCHADLHRGQFGARCEQCHTVRGWRVSMSKIQEHQNRFPLVGAHAAVECDACHKSAAVGQFAGLSVNCYTCHQQQYKSAVPDHVASGFPPTCQNCHTSVDTWFGAKFDHARFANFPLTGMHATLPCTACHVGGRFKGTPADCYSCHAKDFNGTTNPNHVQAGFPRECATCHSTAAWIPATFDHSRFTKFPLTGMHQNTPCTSCHVNGKFVGTPTDCASCHISAYNQTTNPNHKQLGFPTDCSICHSTSGWTPASFDHSKTAFPLTGKHVGIPCATCHVNGNFKIPSTCVSCHMKDYQGTTNPNHVQAGFPTDCQVCHSTNGWTPAQFDHSKTKFPLTGAHINVPCAKCHINGRYQGTPTDCYSCHKADYTGTTNPNHVAAHFPTTCTTCHNTATWLGAVFNHTWFPIYSGTHAGKWVTCNDCHVNPSDYSVFSCTTCHTKADTDPRHTDVRGYVYSPTSCYTCHPTGQGGN